MSRDAGPLGGLLIADLSTGIAGGYCTKILADGGAEVVKLEPPEGDSLRSWSASGASISDEDDGALFQFLSSSKRSVVVDPVRSADLESAHEIVGVADAVVWSAGSPLAELDAFLPSELIRTHRHLVVTSITPFGLEGPWRDLPATEFTLQAWSGGIIGLGRGDPERAPVFVGGRVGEWLTGAFAAAGTLIAGRRRGGRRVGEIVDVSMLETSAMCLTYYPVTYFESMGRPFRKRRSIVTPGVGLAKDGMVAVGVGTGQQWLDFCVMVDHPEWMEDKSLFRERSHLAPMIDEWFAGHTVDEIRDVASAFRLPNALIGNGSNLPALDHFEARRSFERNVRGGFLQPKPPFRMDPVRLRSPEPAPRLGENNTYSPHMSRQGSDSQRPADFGADADAEAVAVAAGDADAGAGAAAEEVAAGEAPLPFSDLRILDMTAFWAGPSCTLPLAMLGAEVIHLESTSHLDGTRMLGPALTEEQWWERSPIFSALNSNKKSLTLDFRDERGMQLLRRLIATCDVIVENYTPRVLDQAGLSFDSLRDIRDDIILVRMPGFGLEGPWRDNAAFAYTIEDASGFTWMTGYPDEKPLEPYCVGDPNAGVHALIGLLLALEHRRRTGEGVAVEAAMVDAAINVTAEQVIEYSAYGSLLERAGNRGPTAAPQNLYATADIDASDTQENWIATAVTTDAQWQAMSRVLGSPNWALDPSLSSSSGRAEHHDLIDEHLAAWCAERKADEIVETLWPAGIPVAKVVQPHHQTEVAQLEARRFFEVVDHPLAGAAKHSTLPMRFSCGPRVFHRRHAPLLGEHNAELLGELGLTEAEVASLESDGVIGRAPARVMTAGPTAALQDKVAIVTGGANGIGRTTVERFVAEGARVVVADIDAAAGQGLAESLGKAAAFMRTDVTDADQVQALVDFTVEQFGGLHVMFNNAGVPSAMARFLNDDFADFSRVMGTNILGVMLGCQRAARHMKSHGGGSIINTASIAGINAGSGLAAYRASKAAVIHLTKSIAVDLAQYNVRVNCIAPAHIQTAMTNFDLESVIRFMQPLQRQGRGEDVAEAVIYLASERSTQVTGIVLPIDGGTTAGPPASQLKMMFGATPSQRPERPSEGA